MDGQHLRPPPHYNPARRQPHEPTAHRTPHALVTHQPVAPVKSECLEVAADAGLHPTHPDTPSSNGTNPAGEVAKWCGGFKHSGFAPK